MRNVQGQVWGSRERQETSAGRGSWRARHDGQGLSGAHPAATETESRICDAEE